MKKFIFAGITAFVISCTMGFASAYAEGAKPKAANCTCTKCTCDDCQCNNCSDKNCKGCGGSSHCNSGKCCK